MLFLTVSLLSFFDSKSLDKNLQFLSSAIDTTNKSVDNIKQGMDTLHSSIQQFSSNTDNINQHKYTEEKNFNKDEQSEENSTSKQSTHNDDWANVTIQPSEMESE